MKGRRWTKDRLKQQSRKGMYILPSLFTISNIFCGFYSSSASIKGSFELAALLIGIAMVLDTLDGRIARMTHTASEFGLQLDSLADVITFGMAPGILCTQWAFYDFDFHPLHRAGRMACFLFLVCAASRLARFNVQTSHPHDKRYFIGMPTPASAGFVAATIYCFPDRLQSDALAAVALVVMLFLAFLMVSRVKYRTFKDLNLKQPRSYRTTVIIALIIVGLALNLKIALITLAFVYAISGLIGFAFSRRQKPVETSPESEPSPIPINPS